MPTTQAATVSLYGIPCGILVRHPCGEYEFRYLPEYIESGHPPVSLSLPVRKEVYKDRHLFGCFDNLVAEGWLLEEQSRASRLNKSDRLGLLIENGLDLPGAITIERNDELQHLLETSSEG